MPNRHLKGGMRKLLGFFYLLAPGTGERIKVRGLFPYHLLAVEERPKRKIGFTVKEKRAVYAVR